jgi:RNA polymerase sigma factor (sigma-70 family)
VSTYRLRLVQDLANTLWRSPRAQRERQINRLEHLIHDVQPGKEYPWNFVVYRLTLYNPPPDDESVEGGELKADLIHLLDELSASLDLQVSADAAEDLLTLDQIRDVYDVSAKTLDEWRRNGLLTKRYTFPDGVERSAAPRAQVDAFIASLGQGPLYRIRVPNDRQRELILSEARGLSDAGNVSFPEAVRRLSDRIGFPPRLVRHALRSHEMAHPEDPLFEPSGVPLDAADRRELLAKHQAGTAAAEIARAVGISRRQVAGYLRTLRAEELLRSDIDYRYDPLFDAPDADEQILNAPELDHPAYREKNTPDRMPAYFADLSHRPLLKKKEETALFRKYNYIKYKFARLRESLKPSQGEDPKLLARLEDLAAQANECRARLVESNLRLVVKLARQHSGPVADIHDLISEGNFVLLRAVDKFDFARGTRFSTYATWCVVKRFARVVPEENYRIQTYVSGIDEILEVQPDKSTSELERKENLEHIRSQLDKVMEHLTERERVILSRRFGLTGARPETLEQIGEVLGITRERVRQLESRALRKAAEQLQIEPA